MLNQLRGEDIDAHCAGQVLFTPIKDIFADIKEALCLNTDVSLLQPRDPRSSGPSAIPIATNLCSIKVKPIIRPYVFLEPPVLRAHGLTLNDITTEDLLTLLRSIRHKSSALPSFQRVVKRIHIPEPGFCIPLA